MHPRTPYVDVAVIGGGPGGATCAHRLAQYGYDVALIDRGPRKRHHVGEAIPSSVHFMLRILEIRLPEEVMRQRPPRHRVYWGRIQADNRTFSPGEESSSLLIWRGVFDRFLREQAAAQGVLMHRDTTVERITAGAEGGYRLRFRRRVGSETSSLDCGFLVDASGRSGLLARAQRQQQKEWSTVAATGHFRTDESDPPTLIESFADGWAWSSPLQDGLRDVTLMFDSENLKGQGKKFYRAGLQSLKHTARIVDCGRPVGPVRTIDATPYAASRFCSPDSILIGDAASFLDPLSAHGVYKAMDSALAAAVVIRTILKRPERVQAAVRFYNGRERDIVRAVGERLRRLYRQETRFSDRPFWQRRGEDTAATPVAMPVPKPPLRGAMTLRAASEVRVIKAPVLENDFIETREVLEVPWRDRQVRFKGEICLPELWKTVIVAPSASQAARDAGVGYEQAWEAIEWLYNGGFLEKA